MPLDPTWVPFCRELWSSAEQQQNYLPGVPEGSDLCITPVSAPENHYVRIKADNRLEADGTLRGTFTLTAEGQSDSNIRRIFTTGFQSEWKSTMERQLLAISPKARLLSVDYGKNPKDYQAAPIKITFRYEIPDYALKGEGEMFFRPMVMNNLYNQVRSYMWIDTSVENRKYGFKDVPVWSNWMKRFSFRQDTSWRVPPRMKPCKEWEPILKVRWCRKEIKCCSTIDWL